MQSRPPDMLAEGLKNLALVVEKGEVKYQSQSEYQSKEQKLVCGTDNLGIFPPSVPSLTQQKLHAL